MCVMIDGCLVLLWGLCIAICLLGVALDVEDVFSGRSKRIWMKLPPI